MIQVNVIEGKMTEAINPPMEVNEACQIKYLNFMAITLPKRLPCKEHAHKRANIRIKSLEKGGGGGRKTLTFLFMLGF